jgi:polyhydroxybutyrate depolymerase
MALLVLGAAGMPGWAAGSTAPIERHWKIEGMDRVGLIFAPKTGKGENSRKAPVLFAFHGHGGNMRQAAARFGFQRKWPEAVVVYLQGLPTPGALTDPQGLRNGWQKTAGDQNDRDLKLFDAALATVMKDYAGDPKRVYATGHSNGGGFTYLLMAERGDRLCAVAPVAAAAGRNQPGLKPKPCLHIAGEKDPLVRFAWQERCRNAVLRVNQCEEKGSSWGQSGPLIATLYPSRIGAPFVWAVHAGGHQFPTGAADLIIRFFKEQPVR